MRVLNPVEKMRAQGFAVDAFRRCGVKAILYFGQKYSVPAFGEYFLRTSPILLSELILILTVF